MIKIKKAIILAAGLGTRLRPLTLKVPKPLLPLNGKLIIENQLNYLKSFGIDDIVINLHYLGDMIKSALGDGEKYGVKIVYSEEPKILGTGGGIKKAVRYFGNDPFLVLNSDAILNVDLNELQKAHYHSKSMSTIVVKKLENDEPFTPIDVEGGYVKSFESGNYYFAGLHVLDPKALDMLPAADVFSCIVNDGYKKLLAADKNIGAFIYDGYFNDVGTPIRYKKAKEDVKNGVYKIY